MKVVRYFAFAVLVAAVPGCGWDEIVYYPLDAGAVDAGSDGSADAGPSDGGDEADAGDGGPSSNLCAGQCVPLGPPNFSNPLLLWFGPEDQAPGCPQQAPSPFTRHGDLAAPPTVCDTCTCKPSTGSCRPPTSFSAHSMICYAPGAVDTSFDAPAAWDGSCTAANPIAAGAQCDGKPCVQSLTIGALEVVDDGCEADIPDPPKVGDPAPPPAGFAAPTWGTLALACDGLVESGYTGCGTGGICIPKNELPPRSFFVCVEKDGDAPCEGDEYVERFVFYRDYEDTRSCTPCGCDAAVEGSYCTGLVSAFTDAACMAPVFGGVPASSFMPPCLDLTPPGQALGSKSMSNIAYHPGTCKPTGGEPMGSVDPVTPATFCCIAQGP